jgi:hypothetical protein|tara:strand:- start:366 stop:473 length:108 start_codon:yes stop_codon:yes gene_type:complete
MADISTIAIDLAKVRFPDFHRLRAEQGIEATAPQS